MKIAFGEFKAADQLSGEPETLRAVLQEQGYLFFRGLIARSRVEPVKRDGIRVCKKFGLVDSRASAEPEWSQRPFQGDELSLEGGLARSLGRLKSLRELIHAPELAAVLETLFGREVFSWAQNQDSFKVIPPGDFTYTLGHVRVATATPAHQDYYSFRSTDFCTFWIPLMDIPEEVGGLVLREGSHQDGFHEHWWCGDEQLGVPESEREAEQWERTGGVVLGGEIGPKNYSSKVWLRTDYRVGDVLIFHPMMVHRGLVNRSGLVRFSADFRYQPKGTPIPWVARYRVYYRSRFLRESRAFIDNLGIDAELAAKVWQRFRDQGPKRQRLDQRVATILDQLR